MLGLDAAGKTTILYRLHMGEVLSTVPTVGRWPISLFIYLPFISNVNDCGIRVVFFFYKLIHLFVYHVCFQIKY